LFEDTERSLGGVDILINCAGTMGKWPLTLPETTDEMFDEVFGVNVKGTYLCCREAIASMRSRGHGSIVNIGSELAFKAAPGATLYCAAKAAVVQFSRALAVEEAANGIRVNVVCPGPVDTNLLNPTVGTIPADIAAQSFAQTAMGRLGTPAEIAEVVWFVAGDKASYMTGAVVPVDGGALAT
jgi:NAD(P)-dependent dehydrogenase (short-subunit alcohol dehydrogenase family)